MIRKLMRCLLTLLGLAGLVGVPLQPVVELLLVAVEAALAAAEGVALVAGGEALLHVALVVEVGHVPPVLLVVVVVGVGAGERVSGNRFI